MRSQREIVSEKERESARAEGGLPSYNWEGGALARGWGARRYVGFWHKILVPNVSFADCCVLWAGIRGNSSQGA